MKINIILIGLILLTSCSTIGQNRSTDEEESLTTKEGNKKETLCGGYTAQREITEEEMAMFRKVTGSGDMTLTPLSVSTQVVAGINYKFWCRFEDKTVNKSGHCWVIIYQPLQGEPQLSGIEKTEE